MNIDIRSPLDMHLHLREGEMLARIAPLSSMSFAGGVIMPNLKEPVDTLEKVHGYRKAIEEQCNPDEFTPYMTAFFRCYSAAELQALRSAIIGIKLYPAGITTQSEAGVSDFSGIEETISVMEELQIPLLVHGESNGFVMDREKEFLKIYERLAKNFPKLHIIMEHITTADAVEFMDKYPNISATVTLHHLFITLDDVIGGLMEPDLFCKPIAKTPRDLGALQDAVLSGHPRVMFGSDSAPHPRQKKECCGCAAGIFSAPVALPMLADFFVKRGKPELLQGFVSDIACRRYRLTPVNRTIRLSQQSWRIPELYNGVKPFGAGCEIGWKLATEKN
ncbi:dihydroorotase [Desulforhopalus singaporensis]|uniref:Dihydroorotase n=1 Tax=Desulforhopalus singaporensis TaxID=91360 RepID=A0A1H0TH84_9BACT|nr:dihydroorotase [Desulforhopalus singaporensis]SDP53050.1 dihydroorotase [Desulforhopalus singaporensis]